MLKLLFPGFIALCPGMFYRDYNALLADKMNYVGIADIDFFAEADIA